MASTRLLTKHGLGVPASDPSARATVYIARAYRSTLLDDVSRELAEHGRGGRRTLLSDASLVPPELRPSVKSLLSLAFSVGLSAAC